MANGQTKALGAVYSTFTWSLVEDYLEYEPLSVIVMKFIVRSFITDVSSMKPMWSSKNGHKVKLNYSWFQIRNHLGSSSPRLNQASYCYKKSRYNRWHLFDLREAEMNRAITILLLLGLCNISLAQDLVMVGRKDKRTIAIGFLENSLWPLRPIVSVRALLCWVLLIPSNNN